MSNENAENNNGSEDIPKDVDPAVNNGSVDNKDEDEAVEAFRRKLTENERKTASGATNKGVLSFRDKDANEPTEEEKTPIYKEKRKGVVYSIYGILLILAAFITFLILNENFEEAEEVELTEEEEEIELVSVPSAISSVSSSTELEEVCEPFTDIQLDCTAVEEVNDEHPRGNLISQSLLTGEEVEVGSEIEITYSRGPVESEFPELRDETQDYAEEALYTIGVDIDETRTISHSGIAEGRVIFAELDGERLEAEEVVENGSIVTLVISDGTVEVPDWANENREVVENEASEIGIDVEFTTEESDETPGTVLGQSDVGSVVNDAVVEVIVATPFESVELEIPDVLGESPEVVQGELAEVGFREIYLLEVPSPDVEEPTVTQIAPGVGSTTLSDNNVTILVSVPLVASVTPEEDITETD